MNTCFVIAAVVSTFCLGALPTTATRVEFLNRCGYAIQLVQTSNGGGQPFQLCFLNPNNVCVPNYNGGAMNFKHGFAGQGITLAEFSFNGWNGLDFYDLSVINGFNVPMQIRTNTGGPTVNCHHSSCPDAYLYPNDNTKTRSTRTGGTFVVTFCP